MWTMTKRDRDYDFDKDTKTIRFDDEERERLRIVMHMVRKRNSLADPSKLIKDLMGLTSNLGITETERQIIAGVAQPLTAVSRVQRNLDSETVLRQTGPVADSREATHEEDYPSNSNQAGRTLPDILELSSPQYGDLVGEPDINESTVPPPPRDETPADSSLDSPLVKQPRKRKAG